VRLSCLIGFFFAFCTRPHLLLPVMEVEKHARTASALSWLAGWICKGLQSIVANQSSRQDIKEAFLILSDTDEADCNARGFCFAEEGKLSLNTVSTCVVVNADEQRWVFIAHICSQTDTKPFALSVALMPAPPVLNLDLPHLTDFSELAAVILVSGRHSFITSGAGVGNTMLLRTLLAAHKAGGVE